MGGGSPLRSLCSNKEAQKTAQRYHPLTGVQPLCLKQRAYRGLRI
jgi:hypothetical protein